MKNRMMVSLWAVLILAAPVVAQVPVVEPLGPPTAVPEMFPGPVYVEGPPGGSGQFWATGEYLLGWIQEANVPPLVTTSPVGTPRGWAGALGRPGTEILFGGTMNDEVRSGFRLGTGYWFDPQRTFGIEAGFSMLERQSTIFGTTSAAHPILARPFFGADPIPPGPFDPPQNTPEAVLVGFPGVATGAIDARVSSGTFYEGRLGLVENFYDSGWLRFDSLLGYRFFRYDEGLHVRQTIFPQEPIFVPGTQLVATDNFNTQNEFHGGDIGVRATVLLWDDLALGLLARAMVGSIRRQVNIQGQQVVAVPGVDPVVQSGGLLALDSNIGRHSDSTWTVHPELGVHVAWQANPNLRLRLGYSVMFLHQLARAGDQVDLTIDSDLLPPAVRPPVEGDRPTFELRRSSAWIQTLGIGVEVNY